MPSPHARLALKSHVLGALAAALTSAMLVAPAYAAPFSYGELKGSFDSTFSVGALYRLNNPSPTYYGTTNSFDGVAGLQTSVNSDDGNLNYKKGTVSQLLKGSHDLELRYRNFGGFARGYYFRDLKAGNTARTPLTDQAQDRVKKAPNSWMLTSSRSSMPPIRYRSIFALAAKCSASAKAPSSPTASISSIPLIFRNYVFPAPNSKKRFSPSTCSRPPSA